LEVEGSVVTSGVIGELLGVVKPITCKEVRDGFSDIIGVDWLVLVIA
jgi:hypothetical protein